MKHAPPVEQYGHYQINNYLRAFSYSATLSAEDKTRAEAAVQRDTLESKNALHRELKQKIRSKLYSA